MIPKIKKKKSINKTIDTIKKLRDQAAILTREANTLIGKANELSLKQKKKERIWKVIDTILQELIDNLDIIETTARYVNVNYIVDTLKENNCLKQKEKNYDQL